MSTPATSESNEHLNRPETRAVIIGSLLRDGLLAATVGDDVLILDADPNQVMRIRCANTTIDDIIATLDTHGMLANTPADDGVSDVGTSAPTMSRRRALQGAVAAGVVGVTVLTLPDAAMAASPLAPAGITATPGAGQVTITWTEVVGTTYQVYFGTGDDLSAYVSATGALTTTSPTTVTGLTGGTEYSFFVEGTGADNVPRQSDIVTATPTPCPDTVYAATEGGLGISTDGGTSFTNRTTADGLGSNNVRGVFVVGSNVYAATNSGLSVSTDGGTTFTNRTTADGLGGNFVRVVFVVGSNVYAASSGGLSISTDGGVTFTNRTTADGLGTINVRGVFVAGSNVYAATQGGLSISTDGGTTFTNRTTADGLGGDNVQGVFVLGLNVYAATQGGLSISTNGGTSFDNRTDVNSGLASNLVIGLTAVPCAG